MFFPSGTAGSRELFSLRVLPALLAHFHTIFPISPLAHPPPLKPSIRVALDLLGELWKVDLFMMVRRRLHKRPVMYFHKPSVPNSNVFHICCYTNS